MSLAFLDLVALGLSLAASLSGAIHALMTKQDPRSASAWITLCLLFPLLGVLVYVAIGNNRISTRAQQLYADRRLLVPPEGEMRHHEALQEDIDAPYRNLSRLAHAVSGNDLLAGNRVETLYNGDAAYSAMLAAINAAETYVCLSSYIFEPTGIGERFISSLQGAQDRGVDVRVLIDGVGDLYSFPTISHRLRRIGTPVARFLPPRLIPPNFSINLRNHRKILVVDDRIAFSGGMNIRNKLLATPDAAPAVADLHFSFSGPVVAQIRSTFERDWMFCGGAELQPAVIDMQPLEAGAKCRVITDGPSENLDKLTWVLVGAISAAQASVKIMTPYFLPSRVLTIALQTAVLRGVAVHIILPRRNNLRFMHWAAWHVIRPLIAIGVQVFFREGPFAHSKLFLVDDYYAQVGSANLDPRSLRLNFELAVEIYDAEVGAKLAAHFAEALSESKNVTRHDLASRNPIRRLRDAVVWLFSPYL